jgi:hypothetical protein
MITLLLRFLIIFYRLPGGPLMWAIASPKGEQAKNPENVASSSTLWTSRTVRRGASPHAWGQRSSKCAARSYGAKGGWAV